MTTIEIGNIAALEAAMDSGDAYDGDTIVLSSTFSDSAVLTPSKLFNNFRGTFDGNGKTIIYGTGTVGGMFKLDEGTVKNLTIDASNCDITGDNGGLVNEEAQGTIENCHITLNNITGNDAGGLCGAKAGGYDLGTECRISNCSVVLNDLTGNEAGGLCGTRAGSNSAYCTITNCSVVMNNIEGTYAGGLCGRNAANRGGICLISNCVVNANGYPVSSDNNGPLISITNPALDGGHAAWVGNVRVYNCYWKIGTEAVSQTNWASEATNHYAVRHKQLYDANNTHDTALNNTPEGDRSYSSVYNNDNAGVGYARSTINSELGWAAGDNDLLQSMVIDLGVTKNIVGVKTQGSEGADEWVTKYYFEYSTDNTNWTIVPNDWNGVAYESDEADGAYTGNVNRNSIKFNVFQTVVEARYIKIHPMDWYGHITMRADVVVEETSTSVPDYNQLNTIILDSAHPYVENITYSPDPLLWFNSLLLSSSIKISSIAALKVKMGTSTGSMLGYKLSDDFSDTTELDNNDKFSNFAGLFIGNGKTIKYASGKNNGMFDLNEGTVQNLTINATSCDIISTNGGLVNEEAQGTIENCHITLNNITGQEAGGLCGKRAGYNSGNCTITDCSVTMNDCSGSQSGGLCGTHAASNSGNCTITNCSVTMNDCSGSQSGGLCGTSTAMTSGTCTITNCSVTMNDCTTNEGGGMCAGYTASYGGKCMISNCLVTMNDFTGSHAGGYIGRYSATDSGVYTISNCVIITNNFSGSGYPLVKDFTRWYKCAIYNCYYKMGSLTATQISITPWSGLYFKDVYDVNAPSFVNTSYAKLNNKILNIEPLGNTYTDDSINNKLFSRPLGS